MNQAFSLGQLDGVVRCRLDHLELEQTALLSDWHLRGNNGFSRGETHPVITERMSQMENSYASINSNIRAATFLMDNMEVGGDRNDVSDKYIVILDEERKLFSDYAVRAQPLHGPGF